MEFPRREPFLATGIANRVSKRCVRPRPLGPPSGSARRPARSRGKPGERVAGPAEQQQVHRAEEQECRVLARAAAGGQIEKLIVSRDGPAQRAVQRRGGEFGRVLERPAYRLAIGHELSLGWLWPNWCAVSGGCELL